MQKIGLCIFFLLLLFGNIASAENKSSIIKVGVVNARAPFAAPTNNGYKGISTDLWQTIAANEKIPFTYVFMEQNTDAALMELAKGNVDVLIGPISVTYQRYRLVDYSHPYFLNETALIVHHPSANIGHIAAAFWKIVISPFIIFFLAFFLIYVHVYWFFERHENKNIPKRYFSGVSYVIWLHLLQTCHTHVPHSLMGRVFALIWLLALAALLTSIVATVTSTLTAAVTNTSAQFNQLNDLQDQSVAVIRGTRTLNEIEKAGAKIVEVDSLDEGVELLLNKKVKAVADDYIIAKTYLEEHNYPELEISNVRIANSVYAIAVRKNEPLLQEINRQILFLEDNGYTQYVCEKYIRKDADLCAI